MKHVIFRCDEHPGCNWDDGPYGDLIGPVILHNPDGTKEVLVPGEYIPFEPDLGGQK